MTRILALATAATLALAPLAHAQQTGPIKPVQTTQSTQSLDAGASAPGLSGGAGIAIGVGAIILVGLISAGNDDGPTTTTNGGN